MRKESRRSLPFGSAESTEAAKVRVPKTANPALGGILSRRLHAFDGAGRCYLALGHLTNIRSGMRSEDPCSHPVVHA